jgi:2'-5' RNA ligase
MQPLSWPVSGFCLVGSTLTPAGAHYEVIGQWPQDR